MSSISWGRSEDGYVVSKCGRFRIVPEFCGRSQPIWYRVEDSRADGIGAARFATQRVCKQWVDRSLNPPQEREWPTVTDDML